jgi:hypothetical protein
VLHRFGPVKQSVPAQTQAAPKSKATRARAEYRHRYEATTPQTYYGTPNIMAPER